MDVVVNLRHYPVYSIRDFDTLCNTGFKVDGCFFVLYSVGLLSTFCTVVGERNLVMVL